MLISQIYQEMAALGIEDPSLIRDLLDVDSTHGENPTAFSYLDKSSHQDPYLFETISLVQRQAELTSKINLKLENIDQIKVTCSLVFL